jgi:poly(A) polymerase
MIGLKHLITEGAKEIAIEDFLKNLIRGTEWENNIFIAGGYVRDFVMGKEPKDLDLMVNKPNGGIKFAEWITKRVGNYKEGSNPVIFPRFGTAKFNLNGTTHRGHDLSGTDIEAVMPRSEQYTAGSRKPEVGFSSLKGDAERRDLTVNSLFKNLSTGEILDLTGKGMDDIKQGIVRTPLEPSKTFTDDPLRMLRVVRFYAKYGWEVPLHIIKALKANAHQLENISAERIQDELNKMLMTSNPDKAIKLMKTTNLLQFIIPELKQAVKMTQNHHHKMDVFGHTLDVLKKTQPNLVQRLMGLFHDIGKISTRSVTPSGVHFYGHEHEGTEIADKIMKRLKYPNEIIDAVKLGIKNHMRLKHGGDTAVDLTDKTLRKFVADAGDQLENILNLIHADNIAHSEASSMPNQIDFVRNRLKSLEATTTKPKLPLTGFDLQKELGLKPGPIFTEIMKAITDAWFENPKLSKQEALKIAKDVSVEKKINESLDLPPPALHQSQQSFDSDFLNYMKSVENGIKSGFKNGKWYPHKSFEGGMPTIGYGHKIQSEKELQRYFNGVSDQEIISLLKHDLEKAKTIVNNYVNSLGVKIPLDKQQLEMLTDFAFNLGSLKKFPKFTTAVINKDWDTAKKEYKRFSNGNELKDRNQQFFKKYLQHLQ